MLTPLTAELSAAAAAVWAVWAWHSTSRACAPAKCQARLAVRNWAMIAASDSTKAAIEVHNGPRRPRVFHFVRGENARQIGIVNTVHAITYLKRKQMGPSLRSSLVSVFVIHEVVEEPNSSCGLHLRRSATARTSICRYGSFWPAAHLGKSTHTCRVRISESAAQLGACRSWRLL
jgi:hypothetical protein